MVFNKIISSFFKSKGVNPLQSISDNLLKIQKCSPVVDLHLCPYLLTCLQHMNDVSLCDVGLTSEDVEIATYSQCMNVVSHPDFQMSVFLIPAGCSLPLHDHPNMVVCSKIVSGTMQVKSLSPLFPQELHMSGAGVASLDWDVVKTPMDDSWLLTPSSGNIHSFTAKSSCVVLDILLPPYCEEEQRTCVFYSAEQSAEGDNNWHLTALTETEQSEVQIPIVVDYNGYRPVAE